ncbi:MAG TPA: hypothetical protein PKB06_06185 [Actinotalea sp.]|nr:hypothetical protein [Actinotalea sp.]
MDRYEPLPEQVQAAIQVTAVAGMTGVAADYESVYAANEAVTQQIGQATAKKVVVVYRALGARGSNGPGPVGLTGSNTIMFDGCFAWATQAKAQAAAQGGVNGREDANTFVVVVAQG